MVDNIVVKEPEFTVIPQVYGAEVCEPNFRLPNAMRSFYLIHYVFSGAGEFTSPRGTYTVSSGQMFIIKPGEMTSYASDSQKPWSYSWVGFTFGDGMDHTGCSVLDFLKEDVISSEECRTIFEKIRTLKVPTYHDYLALNTIIYDLFWTVSSHYGASRHELKLKDYIDISIQFIQVNYQNKLSVELVSDFLGIDRRYFCSIFTKKLGISPQRYIIKYRLEKACEMLLMGYNVTYAAQNCGYPDIYTFSKIFKKHFNIAPSKYKALHK